MWDINIIFFFPTRGHDFHFVFQAPKTQSILEICRANGPRLKKAFCPLSYTPNNTQTHFSSSLFQFNILVHYIYILCTHARTHTLYSYSLCKYIYTYWFCSTTIMYSSSRFCSFPFFKYISIYLLSFTPLIH